jgi:glycosyltransferase involved in cell wall biosynthesis
MEFESHELYEDTSDNAFRYLSQMKEAGYGVVVSAGRLTIQKGLSHLLQAFRHVVDARPKSLLLLVGPGEQYHELIEQAAELAQKLEAQQEAQRITARLGAKSQGTNSSFTHSLQIIDTKYTSNHQMGELFI